MIISPPKCITEYRAEMHETDISHCPRSYFFHEFISKGCHAVFKTFVKQISMQRWKVKEPPFLQRLLADSHTLGKFKRTGFLTNISLQSYTVVEITDRCLGRYRRARMWLFATDVVICISRCMTIFWGFSLSFVAWVLPKAECPDFLQVILDLLLSSQNHYLYSTYNLI